MHIRFFNTVIIILLSALVSACTTVLLVSCFFLALFFNTRARCTYVALRIAMYNNISAAKGSEGADLL